jgi:hypothetical protein
MTILTGAHPSVNLQTQVAGEYNLELGERWEQLLADYLTAQGLPSYRACQKFIKAKVMSSRLELWRVCLEFANVAKTEAEALKEYQEVSCQLRVSGKDHRVRQMFKPGFKPDPNYKVLQGDPDVDYSLLRPHQRDILVKIDRVKRLSVEVKALTPSAFDRANIQIGCCEKYDKKEFRIGAIVLINQATGDAWVASGEMSEMLRQPSADGDDTFSYAVERSRLTPLDTWIDATKDIHKLS